MSAAQRVTSPTFGPAATGRIASAGRNVASVSYPRVADAGGSNAMGPQEQSVRYDDGYHPQERREQQEQQHLQQQERQQFQQPLPSPWRQPSRK